MNEIKTKYLKKGMTDLNAKDLVFADTHERNVESSITNSQLLCVVGTNHPFTKVKR